MLNVEEEKTRISKEGFTIINVYDDPPGEFFADHDHPADQKLVVIRGSMTVVMAGKTTELKEGDEIFFPARVLHSAKMGPAGCYYVDGERPQ